MHAVVLNKKRTSGAFLLYSSRNHIEFPARSDRYEQHLRTITTILILVITSFRQFFLPIARAMINRFGFFIRRAFRLRIVRKFRSVRPRVTEELVTSILYKFTTRTVKGPPFANTTWYIYGVLVYKLTTIRDVRYSIKVVR